MAKPKVLNMKMARSMHKRSASTLSFREWARRSLKKEVRLSPKLQHIVHGISTTT